MIVTVLKPIFGEAASQVVNVTSTYSGTVLFKKEHWVIDAKSILGLLALALQPGQEIEISADEGDEVIESLLNLGLFEKK